MVAPLLCCSTVPGSTITVTPAATVVLLAAYGTGARSRVPETFRLAGNGTCSE